MNFLFLPGFVVMGSRSPKSHVTSVSICLMAVGTTLVFGELDTSGCSFRVVWAAKRPIR
jgi:hypothetical protein